MEFLTATDFFKPVKIDPSPGLHLRIELFMPSRFRSKIIRADILADITAKEPFADLFGQGFIAPNRRFILYRQIRDASPGIHLIISQKGTRRTNVNADPARSTAARMRLVIFKFKIRDQTR